MSIHDRSPVHFGRSVKNSRFLTSQPVGNPSPTLEPAFSPLWKPASSAEREEFWTGSTGFTGWEGILEVVLNEALLAPH